MGLSFLVRTSFSKELISFIKKGLTKFQNALRTTTSFSKELILFIKKGLTKFQNDLLQTFLGYDLKVCFYSNIFANTHICSFFLNRRQFGQFGFSCLTRSEKFFFPFYHAHFCFKGTDTLAPASSTKFTISTIFFVGSRMCQIKTQPGQTG